MATGTPRNPTDAYNAIEAQQPTNGACNASAPDARDHNAPTNITTSVMVTAPTHAGPTVAGPVCTICQTDMMRCVCQRSPGMLGPSPSAPTYRAVPYSEPYVNPYPAATGSPLDTTGTAQASGGSAGLAGQQLNDLDKVFQDLVEDEISLSSEVIVANGAASGQLPRVLLRSVL